MKPRIRRRFGIWYCGRPDPDWLPYIAITANWGHGYTPAEAYADWKAQQ